MAGRPPPGVHLHLHPRHSAAMPVPGAAGNAGHAMHASHSTPSLVHQRGGQQQAAHSGHQPLPAHLHPRAFAGSSYGPGSMSIGSQQGGSSYALGADSPEVPIGGDDYDGGRGPYAFPSAASALSLGSSGSQPGDLSVGDPDLDSPMGALAGLPFPDTSEIAGVGAFSTPPTHALPLPQHQQQRQQQRRRSRGRPAAGMSEDGIGAGMVAESSELVGDDHEPWVSSGEGESDSEQDEEDGEAAPAGSGLLSSDDSESEGGDRSSRPRDRDSGPPQSGADGWYRSGHHGGPRSPSSSGSRLLNLDEELSVSESAAESARFARKLEAERRRRREQSDRRLPCPRMCGVSWGIGGELVYFSNLPLLTHYLVTNQRRRAQPQQMLPLQQQSVAAGVSAMHGAEHFDGSLASPAAMHGPPSLLASPITTADGGMGAGPYIDHEEEESSAWAGASAAQLAAHAASNANTAPGSSPNTTTLSFADPSSLTSPFGGLAPAEVSNADLDEVLPRSYHDLLQLPFVAANLGYVVGDDMTDSEAAEAAEAETEQAEAEVEGPDVEAATAGNATPHTPASDGITKQDVSQSPPPAGMAGAGTAATATPPTDAPIPSAVSSILGADVSRSGVLDLASIDLDSVVLPTSASAAPGGGNLGPRTTSTGTTGGTPGLRSSLKHSGSSTVSLAGRSSGSGGSHSRLDELALGYDLLDELEVEGFGAQPSSASAGGEDFFAGFYNSTLGIGVSAVSLPTTGPAGFGAAASAGPFYRTGAGARSSVNMVPPLPSQAQQGQGEGEHKSSSSAAGAAAVSSSSADAAGAPSTPNADASQRQGSDGGATGGGGGGAGGVAGSRRRSSARMSPSSSREELRDGNVGAGRGGSKTQPSPAQHTWSALSQSILPGSTPSAAAAVVRRRIRINTAVLLMDCGSIMPCSADLAGLYTLAGADAVQICRQNERACMAVGRADLAATWSLAATISHPSVRNAAPSITPWSENPMGGRLAEELLRQYLRLGDIQTVAMLASVFSSLSPSPSSSASSAAAPTPQLLPARPPPVVVQFQEETGVWPMGDSTTDAGMHMGGSGNSSQTSTAAGGMMAEGVPEHPAPLQQQQQQPHSASAADLSPNISYRRTPSPALHSPGSIMQGGRMLSLQGLPAGHPAYQLPAHADASSRTWGPGSKRGVPVHSVYSSGTASPSDTIYNTNLNQRLKWRTGPSSVDAGGFAEQQRLRSGSVSTHPARIEESAAGGKWAASASSTVHSPPLPPYSQGATPSTGATPSSTLTPASSHPRFLQHLPNAGATSSPSSPPAPLSLLLDPVDLYRLLYAEFLYRVGCWAPRAQLLKQLTHKQRASLHAITGFEGREEQFDGVGSVCAHCGMEQQQRRGALHSSEDDRAPPVSLPRCSRCLHYPSTCSVCELSVRGALLCCVLCGHGGHPQHLAAWFGVGRDGEGEEYGMGHGSSTCPTGCGCSCLEAGGIVFHSHDDVDVSRSSLRRRRSSRASASTSASTSPSKQRARSLSQHSRRRVDDDEEDDDEQEDAEEGASQQESEMQSHDAYDGEHALAFPGAQQSHMPADVDQAGHTFFYNPAA